jgi:hypothetical protein
MTDSPRARWGGKPPRPPPPPPPPVVVQCGGGCGSTVLPDSTFAEGEVGHMAAPSAAACCALCAKAGPSCSRWAWHPQPQGKWGKNECHLHGDGSTARAKKGVTAGVMNRTVV